MSGLFRFLTAGESHGEALVALIDGIPAGLPPTEGHINEDLASMKGCELGLGFLPLKTVDLATKEAVEAVVERSDVRAVPAAGIVGGDSLEEIRRNYDTHLASLKTW